MKSFKVTTNLILDNEYNYFTGVQMLLKTIH